MYRKFRAISEVSRVYVYGSLLYQKGKPVIQTRNGKLVPCQKGTESQFTGILDKNGVEIYDRDWLFDESITKAVVKEGSQPKGYKWLCQTEYQDGSFVLTENGSDMGYFLVEEAHKLKVVSQEFVDKHKNIGNGLQKNHEWNLR
jgi:hypothetical protein